VENMLLKRKKKRLTKI